MSGQGEQLTDFERLSRRALEEGVLRVDVALQHRVEEKLAAAEPHRGQRQFPQRAAGRAIRKTRHVRVADMVTRQPWADDVPVQVLSE